MHQATQPDWGGFVNTLFHNRMAPHGEELVAFLNTRPSPGEERQWIREHAQVKRALKVCLISGVLSVLTLLGLLLLSKDTSPWVFGAQIFTGMFFFGGAVITAIDRSNFLAGVRHALLPLVADSLACTDMAKYVKVYVPESVIAAKGRPLRVADYIWARALVAKWDDLKMEAHTKEQCKQAAAELDALALTLPR